MRTLLQHDARNVDADVWSEIHDLLAIRQPHAVSIANNDREGWIAFYGAFASSSTELGKNHLAGAVLDLDPGIILEDEVQLGAANGARRRYAAVGCCRG